MTGRYSFLRRGVIASATATGFLSLAGFSGVEWRSHRESSFTRSLPPAAEQCRPAKGVDVNQLLAHSASALGLTKLDGRIRVSSGTELNTDRFQADRMYPPYPYRTSNIELAVDWPNGTLRQGPYLLSPTSRALIPGPGKPPIAAPSGFNTDQVRAMDPWIVIGDWQRASGVAATQECLYRDYWRTVLTRKTSDGNTERLFVDAHSGFPVKLDRRERDALWGDVLTEYLWSTWLKFSGVAVPLYTHRLQDGEVVGMRRVAQHALVPRDSAGLIEVPHDLPAAPAPPSASTTPDTVRVGPTTFILTMPAYSNVITLQHDTVVVIDAQINEARARADSAWIGKLFPGRHPIVLVVTDLAWPHISGVRFWAANGVSIVTHRASKDFLVDVLNHRWTLAPDLLEQRRNSAHIRVQSIDDHIDLAGGGVQIRAIGGFGSEGALMAYIPSEHFLYAGDYIQQGALLPPRPGLFDFTYADEVIEGVRRNNFAPERFSAMHVGLTPWTTILEKRATR